MKQTTLDLFAPPRLAWIDAHPRAWAFMLERTRHYAAAGKHFSPRLIFEETRYHAPEWAAHEAYACNNNVLADLAAALRREVPEAAELMETRGRAA